MSWVGHVVMLNLVLCDIYIKTFIGSGHERNLHKSTASIAVWLRSPLSVLTCLTREKLNTVYLIMQDGCTSQIGSKDKVCGVICRLYDL